MTVKDLQMWKVRGRVTERHGGDAEEHEITIATDGTEAGAAAELAHAALGDIPRNEPVHVSVDAVEALGSVIVQSDPVDF
jgi:hypothetical protein